MEALSFNDLPAAIAEIKESVARQGKMLEKILRSNNLKRNEWPEQEELPISVEEVSAITGLSTKTIYLKAADRSIPSMKRGGRLYFYKSEVLAWLKKGKRKMKEDIL